LHAEPSLVGAVRQAWVGQRMERLEDDALLNGRGAYADDLGTRPGTLHAAVLRSPHPHARLLGIHTQAALALRGVRAVLTGADVQAWAQPFVVGVKQPMQHWALAVDRVRHVGEPVAVVVAEDRYIAEDALDLLQVEYEPLPVVMDIERALQDGTLPLHEAVGSNVVSDREFCYGDPGSAFAQPGVRTVRTTVHYPRNSCSPIECGVVIAEHLPGDEGYDVLSNFMGPFSLHAVMAMALKVPGNKLRHRVPAIRGQLRRQAGGVPVRGVDVPGLTQGGGAGEVGRGPPGAPERRHLGHGAADHHRGRCHTPEAACWRCATTRPTRWAPTCARPNPPPSTACTARSPALMPSTTWRCATAWS